MLPLLLFALAEAAPIQEPVALLYADRPPLYRHGEQGPSGIVLDRVKRALLLSHQAVHWQHESPARIMQRLRAASQPSCGVGWFHTPERAKEFRYSDPIYQQQPLSVLMRADDPRTDKADSFEHLLADPALVRLQRGPPYSPGEETRARYIRYPNAKVVTFTSGTTEELARVIVNGRADFYLGTGEENAYTLRNNPALADKLIAKSYADTPAAQTLFLLCSQRVSGAWLEAFNQAIKQVNIQEKLAPEKLGQDKLGQEKLNQEEPTQE